MYFCLFVGVFVCLFVFSFGMEIDVSLNWIEQCVYVCSLFFFCLTLPLRKNLLGLKRKAINIYFAFILQVL